MIGNHACIVSQIEHNKNKYDCYKHFDVWKDKAGGRVCKLDGALCVKLFYIVNFFTED